MDLGDLNEKFSCQADRVQRCHGMEEQIPSYGYIVHIAKHLSDTVL